MEPGHLLDRDLDGETSLLHFQYPEIDPAEIHTYLNTVVDLPDRFAIVQRQLERLSRQQRTSRIDDQIARVISVYPDVSVDEVRQKLEELEKKTGSSEEDTDPVETVLNTLLGQAHQHTEVLSVSAAGMHANNSTNSVHEYIEAVLAVFPDADMEHVSSRVVSLLSKSKDVLQVLLYEMAETCYPRQAQKQKAPAIASSLPQLHRNIDIAALLYSFPDPVAQFDGVVAVNGAIVTDVYREQALVYLRNEFLRLPLVQIRQVLTECNNRYSPACAKLSTIMASLKSVRKRRGTVRSPDSQDIYFMYELYFVQNHQAVIDYRNEFLNAARLRGDLIECPCCLDVDVFLRDAVRCSDGHLFCRHCVSRYADTVIESGGHVIKCLDPNCGFQFPPSTLRLALTDANLAILSKRALEADVMAANVEDLVWCPYCNYAVVMSDPNNKLLHCQNPLCRRVTCRVCKIPNHFPKPCETTLEKDMRTFVENRMADAMLRKCYRCGKRFYKLTGCHHVTCPCGAQMCYYCRQPFNKCQGTNSCYGTQSDNKQHKVEAEKARVEAMEEFLKQHPEAKSLMADNKQKTLSTAAATAFPLDTDSDSDDFDDDSDSDSDDLDL